MPREIRSEAFYRLKYRVGRLQRLVEMKVPEAILIRESLLLAEAAERLSPDAYRDLAADVATGRSKRLLNLCATGGCEEPVAWIPSAQRPRLSGVCQDTHCLKHARELEAAAMAELDEEEP
jgi:hypothetical protein